MRRFRGCTTATLEGIECSWIGHESYRKEEKNVQRRPPVSLRLQRISKRHGKARKEREEVEKSH